MFPRLVALVAIFLLLRSADASGGYGGNSLSSIFGSSGYGGGEAAAAQSAAPKGPVTVGVESHRSVEVKPVQIMSEAHEPQVIEVPSDDMPVTVHFKSQSSRVLVQQTHTPAQVNEPEHTSSEDEPQRVIHEVVKPVIQEIREIIQPYRRLIQQIQPVIEQTHTVIAKGEPRPQVAPIAVPGAGGSGSSGSGGQGGGGLGFGGSGAKSHGSSFGGAGGYAAASSVVLKQATTQSSESAKPQPSQQKTVYQRQSQVQAQPQHSAESTYAYFTSVAQPKPQTTQNLQQQQQQQYSNSVFSARKGDAAVFRDQLAPSNKPTKTRMTLRPAPVGDLKVSAAKVSLKTLPSVAYYTQPIAHLLQPIQTRFDYVSALHSDDLPLVTFVAQPVRFRARARA